MGNRCAYPGEHYRARSRSEEQEGGQRYGGTRYTPPAPPPSSAFPVRAQPPGVEQTLCPRCQRLLLVPPGAPLFRCPCGVLFRTEALAVRQPPQSLMGRAVMCRRCGSVSMSQADSSSVAMCPCGAPVLPINDMLMSLIAEGAHLQATGRRLRDEEASASRDLIEMLPTCTYTKAVEDHCLATGGMLVLEAADNNDKLSKPARHEHGDDVSCRVCLDDYVEGEELRVLPCFHKFHKMCIDSWLERKKLCPLCNTSVDIIMQDSRELG